MSQRTLQILIAVLVLVVIVLGYGWYSEATKPKDGVNIDFGNGNISVNEDGVSITTD